MNDKKNCNQSKDKNKKKDHFDRIFPPVNDPPVPNRAHTEMKLEFPPEREINIPAEFRFGDRE